MEMPMSPSAKTITGGCLCGALRYEADGDPLYMGHCYCADCQKASGSAFVPFMGFPASALRINGPSRPFVSPAVTGGVATRNSCPNCNSLVFGGVVGESDSFTVYAGSLDDKSHFRPTIAIFARNRPQWALLPPGVTAFDGMPPAG
jgi:hypothetical protein